MLDVTNNVVQFHELPSQYIDPEAPEMLTASNLIPGAVYWTIRSIVSCASHVLDITGLGQGYLTSTTETWELSSLAHKLDNINTHLRMQLTLCPQYLDDNRERHLKHFGSFLRDPPKIIQRFSKLCFAARMIRCHCSMVLPNNGLTLKPFSLALTLNL
ncbi:hypothetical protein JHK82_013230 [Glycine max]|nr:hypothetical protein GLYMA_05G173166v4 [Glycine max]KAG5155261.1 hypothetical protein JHK82_013230 [Glycine max]KAH1134894.1 hypothetical protein GYH30_012958 [Glycine max]